MASDSSGQRVVLAAEILPWPARLFNPTPVAGRRVLEFFTGQLNNDHTRKAYLNAAREFAAWCEGRGILELADVQPIHVAAYVKELQGKAAAPTVKQRLAALRMLFGWLVTGQVIPMNPAHAVRGPKHSAKEGKTPVLAADEARQLLDSIETDTLIGQRDRALIGLMVYTFARVGAALKMQVGDYFVQGRRGWVRLHEKGGKLHSLPCHHNLEAWLDEYITTAGIAADRKGPLFRTAADRSGRTLTGNGLYQQDAYRMIRRRAETAGIKTQIGNHTFRATGITAYLKNGGRLEVAQQMANHESARTTGLYDHRGDDVSLDEVERIGI
jgi:site-specific recombinase XerD